MATNDQILALVQAKSAGDDARFNSIVLQIEANERGNGRTTAADRIRAVYDKMIAKAGTIQLLKPLPRGSEKLMTASQPTIRLANVIQSTDVLADLTEFLSENRQADLLKSHGIQPARKLLLVGPPGTGKTMTAAAIAHELDLPLMLIRLESLIQSHLGETGANLRLVFDAIEQVPGVYFLDEFDALATTRHTKQDVGEMSRVVNSLLQFLDGHGTSESLSVIIAATNHGHELDKAVFRRFDLIIEYALPDCIAATKVLLCCLDSMKIELDDHDDWEVVQAAVAEYYGSLSHADLTKVATKATKRALLAGKMSVPLNSMVTALNEVKVQSTQKSKQTELKTDK